MINPLRTMKADALYAQLGRLIAEAPNLKAAQGTHPPLTQDQMLWLGRAKPL